MTNLLTVSAFIGVLVVAGVSWGYLFYYPGWRQQRLLATPFPAAWLKVVRQTLPFYDRLPDSEQQQLRDMIRLFIADKTFYGSGGLQMTDTIRVTIATEACLLLLNRKTGIYPDLQHILVYPDAFRAAHVKRNDDGTVSDGETGLLGESWHNGKVILSWEDVIAGAANPQDGRNVVFHEFSHQLDTEDGSANGAPVMPVKRLHTWAAVFSREFAQLNVAAENQQHTVMDYYGATNPAEFFAVATETFFEKPFQLVHRHPELFEELKRYYRVDPRDWYSSNQG